jgi:tyrosyl-tRNA synthetase
VAVRADVELGGTDQTFNLLLGRDVQRAFGQPEQVVLTVPILPGIDGAEKMSKSLGNHIGVTADPAEMYGRTMSLPDEAMDAWFRLLALPAGDDSAAVAPRDRKRALARAIVERFHGRAAAGAAQEGFDRLFVDHAAPEQIDDVDVHPADGSVHLPHLLSQAFGLSASEARRLLGQGGVRLDGAAIGAGVLDLPAAGLDGRVLQVGRRRFRRVRITD